MKSEEYKQIISRIVKNSLKRYYPGLKLADLDKVGVEVAKNVHARMYGANVDGVDSPIWRDWSKGENQHTNGTVSLNQPTVEAKELLND